ncbi:patatin-like phospholipase family protein [Geomonas sp. RF6]|uniref:patatin-like phospholipase family protein n=1 Tax=Geomonas sp. RF6 TaxID=2897342 RepID=UPI001E637136|nr:patatin-like phospholipase family protein [Geomonas sp. RF6]UFS70688.1 patatin-like phospholipase family protein [Geomonas sp. RF6]
MSQEKDNLYSHAVKEAHSFLGGGDTPPEKALALALKLKKECAFGYGRRVLRRALSPAPGITEGVVQPIPAAISVKFHQTLALCTYKDQDLPTDTRNDDALEILEQGDPLETTTNRETLGLAGAIYKRKWEYDNHKQHLERSLAYYFRGYQISLERGWGRTPKEAGRRLAENDGDYGYTAINAAFIEDLLASQEIAEAEAVNGPKSAAAGRIELAQQIRKAIIAGLEPLPAVEPGLLSDWWFLVTVGEAYFGLGEYDKALQWLKKAKALPGTPSWEVESTTRQLAALLTVQRKKPDAYEKAREVIVEFAGAEAAAASAFTGKVGLALSGGGFRASLFHIGVLARLAELDVLRRVEVMSCVSGGSIIGASYYLELQHLLERKEDSAITREDYIEIVKRLEKEFLAGVQTNIRTRVAANLWINFRMLASPHYSRTLRVGELYEKKIYSRVPDGKGDKERYLGDMMVAPKGERRGFSPKEQNWRRVNKVPILILNATTLNTGHNWQFTATWMGKPPAGIDSEIDSNYRLRRMYYRDAPPEMKKIRLGEAVAASSCVPGLFEPISLPHLYPEKVVRLVDGGVHDNQGAAGLLEQGCSVLLVSDASGQMGADDHPGTGFLAVPLRANSILQSRVRSAQYDDLDARKRSSLLKGLLFIHLKKELDVVPVEWIGCEDHLETEKPAAVTSYGVNKKCQQALANIRTDLDSFSDTEAYCLMLSGYRMTERYLQGCTTDLCSGTDMRGEWDFLAVDGALSGTTPDKLVLRQLQVGAKMALKVWSLVPNLKLAALVLLLLAIVAVSFLSSQFWTFVILKVTVSALVISGVTLVLNRLFGAWFMRLVRYRKSLQEIGVAVAMLSVGWLLASLHLLIFDKWFLRQGKVPPLPSRGTLWRN